MVFTVADEQKFGCTRAHYLGGGSVGRAQRFSGLIFGLAGRLVPHWSDRCQHNYFECSALCDSKFVRNQPQCQSLSHVIPVGLLVKRTSFFVNKLAPIRGMGSKLILMALREQHINVWLQACSQ